MRRFLCILDFYFAVPEQMQQMWSNFYPHAEDLTVSFSNAVNKSLNEQGLSWYFFVSHMDSIAEEALKNISLVVESIL